MTLVNAWIERGRALVAADTVACDETSGGLLRRADGTLAEDTKLVALPHLRCVLTSLGALELRHWLQLRAMYLPDVDQAAERMPVLLQEAGSAIGLASRRGCGSAVFKRYGHAGDTVLTVGWSARRGQVVGLAFKSQDGFRSVRVDEHAATGDGAVVGFYSPGVLDRYGFPADDDTMLQLARRQVDACRVKHPGAAIGGRLMLAEVTERAITVREAGQLGIQ